MQKAIATTNGITTAGGQVATAVGITVGATGPTMFTTMAGTVVVPTTGQHRLQALLPTMVVPTMDRAMMGISFAVVPRMGLLDLDFAIAAGNGTIDTGSGPTPAIYLQQWWCR